MFFFLRRLKKFASSSTFTLVEKRGFARLEQQIRVAEEFPSGCDGIFCDLSMLAERKARAEKKTFDVRRG